MPGVPDAFLRPLTKVSAARGPFNLARTRYDFRLRKEYCCGRTPTQGRRAQLSYGRPKATEMTKTKSTKSVHSEAQQQTPSPAEPQDGKEIDAAPEPAEEVAQGATAGRPDAAEEQSSPPPAEPQAEEETHEPISGTRAEPVHGEAGTAATAQQPITGELKPHPYAELLPRMQEDDFAKLVADIKENGLRDEIIVTPDGQVLDGMSRLRACGEAGVEPRFQTVSEAPEKWFSLVISKNVVRRHLTKVQLAAMAADLVTTKHGDNRYTPRPAKLPVYTQRAAAALFGVSEKYVRNAVKIKKADGSLHQQVKAGEISIEEALAKVRAASAEPPIHANENEEPGTGAGGITVGGPSAAPKVQSTSWGKSSNGNESGNRTNASASDTDSKKAAGEVASLIKKPVHTRKEYDYNLDLLRTCRSLADIIEAYVALGDGLCDDSSVEGAATEVKVPPPP